MSGRAGRRGKDPYGIVLILCKYDCAVLSFAVVVDVDLVFACFSLFSLFSASCYFSFFWLLSPGLLFLLLVFLHLFFLSSVAFCVLRSDSVPDAPSLQKMMTGKPQPLSSQFRLSYKHDPEPAQSRRSSCSCPFIHLVILHCVECARFSSFCVHLSDLGVEQMVRRSFSEFSTQKDNDRKRRMFKKVCSCHTVFFCLLPSIRNAALR